MADVTSFTLTVNKELTGDDFNVIIRDYMPLNIQKPFVIVGCPSGAEGNVTVYVGGKSLSKKVNSTKMYFTLDEFEITDAGDYYVSVIYESINLDSKYIDVVGEGEEYEYFLILTIPSSVQIGDYLSSYIHIQEREDAGGILTLYVDGEFFDSRDLSDEEYGSFDLNTLTYGMHPYNLTYSGDGDMMLLTFQVYLMLIIF